MSSSTDSSRHQLHENCNQLLTELKKVKQLQQRGLKLPASEPFHQHDQQAPGQMNKMKMTTSIVTNFFMTKNPIQLLLLQTTLLQKLWCITYTTEPIAG